MQISRPHWKMLCLLALLFAGLSVVIVATAQTAEGGYEPRSGDAKIDRHLADINDYANRYPASFVDEMARYYTVPRPYVEAMLQQPNWTAGDIYMACALARVAGQPCRAVVREWSRDHSEGWKSVAERLDVKPGSSQYRRLRKGIDETYARWDRPQPAAD
ncbi:MULTISPECIES: hypothetical protein [unclassified Pseudoxanthomonas]|jgi:hypothetical protein|uniref:hypothetical protein n=1 Tax=unclassified Pseudoxanthomonas TaxID=2645906 RepID=UPI0030773400